MKLLNKYNFDQGFVEKVKNLVLKHEEGGDLEADILCDADSLSFFETNIVFYFETRDLEATRKKIKFMYERMSKKSQEFVKDISYDNLELNKIFREVVGK